MKPLIGVTTTPDNLDGDRICRLFASYMEAVREAGGIPVLLFDCENEAAILAKRLDGMMLSGGGDVNPSLYGEENLHSRLVDDPRDRAERALLTAFCAEGKPVLGICRGMQLMAVALGGSLWQDIRLQTGMDHVPNRDHVITVREASSFLSNILPSQVNVNSLHHQAVRTLPPRFTVSAEAPDGIAEAMEATDGRPLYAVQFHPERMAQNDGRMAGIFRVLTKR